MLPEDEETKEEYDFLRVISKRTCSQGTRKDVFIALKIAHLSLMWCVSPCSLIWVNNALSQGQHV